MSTIQKSTIVLYMDVPLKPEENKLIENISSFLETNFSNDKITKNNYNYFKNEFETEIVFNNFSDFEVGDGVFELYDLGKFSSYNWNYCKVIPTISDGLSTDTGVNPLFYFVTGTRWTSEKSVRLSLRLDTLNTFPIGTGYSFGNKSHILRQHKDRLDIFLDGNYVFSNPDDDIVFDGSGIFTTVITANYGYPFLQVSNFQVFNAYDGIISWEIYKDELHIELTNYEPGSPVHFSFSFKTGCGIVDRYNEGLTPQLVKTDEKDIYDSYSGKWYLLYRNANDVSPDNLQNPVDCYLVPDEPIQVQYNSSDILPSSLANNTIYVVSAQINGGEDAEFNAVSNNEILCTMNVTGTRWLIADEVFRYCYFFKNSNGKIDFVSISEYRLSGNVMWRTHEIHQDLSAIYFTTTSNTKAAEITQFDPNYSMLEQYKSTSYMYCPTSSYDITFTVSISTGILNGVDTIDRTDNKIIKLIEFPYCPASITFVNSTTILAPTGWFFTASSNMMKMQNGNTKFDRTFTAKDEINASILSPAYPLWKRLPNSITGTESRQQTNGIDDYEYKLYHSDFYREKFVYDSFAMDINLEQLHNELMDYTINVQYSVTSTINSKFMFRFPNYIHNLKYSHEDYPGVVVVARNNEAMLLNSQYINYIRTGYNYDIKNKNRSQLASGIGIVGNALTMATSIGGNPMGALMGATGMVGNISNIIKSEEAIEQKLIQAKNQAITVSGADDLDLLDVYSGNRAKFCFYECSPRIKQQLSNLFYYFGYVEDKYGTPDTSSRIWFNYVQGDMIINPIVHLSEIVMNDLKSRYSGGVTIFHNRNNSWDINQTKENWEGTLL